MCSQNIEVPAVYNVFYLPGQPVVLGGLICLVTVCPVLLGCYGLTFFAFLMESEWLSLPGSCYK